MAKNVIKIILVLLAVVLCILSMVYKGWYTVLFNVLLAGVFLDIAIKGENKWYYVIAALVAIPAVFEIIELLS